MGHDIRRTRALGQMQGRLRAADGKAPAGAGDIPDQRVAVLSELHLPVGAVADLPFSRYKKTSVKRWFF